MLHPIHTKSSSNRGDPSGRWSKRPLRPVIQVRRQVSSSPAKIWTDPRCGGRLVTRGRLMEKLVRLLLSGNDIECLRAYSGGYEAEHGTDASGDLDICLVAIDAHGRLVYMAIDDGSGIRAAVNPGRSRLRRKCRGLGGMLRVWTARRIERASDAMERRKRPRSDAAVPASLKASRM